MLQPDRRSGKAARRSKSGRPPLCWTPFQTPAKVSSPCPRPFLPDLPFRHVVVARRQSLCASCFPVQRRPILRQELRPPSGLDRGAGEATGQRLCHRRGRLCGDEQPLPLVLRVDAERAQDWSREEVSRRWTQLFDGPLLVQHLQSAQERGEDAGLDAATLTRIDEWAERSRECPIAKTILLSKKVRSRLSYLYLCGYNSLMALPIKPLRWVASSKKDLMAMPEEVQDTFGYALHLAQGGRSILMPNRSKASVVRACWRWSRITKAMPTVPCTPCATSRQSMWCIASRKNPPRALPRPSPTWN